MGKAASCIQMLQILNSGRMYKITELAELLETNPRNIIEYRKELEEVGYYITITPGRYGGYTLDKTTLVPALKMLPEEKASIVDAYNFVLAKSDFINRNGYINTMSKVFSSLLIENNPGPVLSVNHLNSRVEQTDIEKSYEIISKAIKKKQAVEVTYKWLKEPTSTFEIHPYQLFLYDNEWRFFCWMIKDGVGDVSCLKLTRVESLKLLDKHFRVWDQFRTEDYLKKNVFTKNGEMFSLTLLAHGIRAKLMKEKAFGSNQVCEDLPNGDVKVTMEMQKNPTTYNTILGFGDLVEIVEPEWLKHKIKELALSIYEKYKK